MKAQLKKQAVLRWPDLETILFCFWIQNCYFFLEQFFTIVRYMHLIAKYISN